MTAVAVLGLGAMGRAIAARLLGAGHDVAVWNRTPGRDEDSSRPAPVERRLQHRP